VFETNLKLLLGFSLHYLVDGVDDELFQPAWEVNAIGAIMTSFPYFENP